MIYGIKVRGEVLRSRRGRDLSKVNQKVRNRMVDCGVWQEIRALGMNGSWKEPLTQEACFCLSLGAFGYKYQSPSSHWLVHRDWLV